MYIKNTRFVNINLRSEKIKRYLSFRYKKQKKIIIDLVKIIHKFPRKLWDKFNSLNITKKKNFFAINKICKNPQKVFVHKRHRNQYIYPIQFGNP